MSRWICSRCGGDATPAISRPSLDDRYAPGFCDRCTPDPGPPDPRKKRAPRPSVALVRADKWDPDLLRQRREREAEERLVRDYRDGNLGDDKKAQTRAVAILARWEAEATRHVDA